MTKILSFKMMVTPDNATLADDNLLNAFIQGNLQQTHHWSSQCRMCTSIDNGVVDSNGNVRGVNNLMIVNATILPLKNTCNTSALVYAAALTICNKMGCM